MLAKRLAQHVAQALGEGDGVGEGFAFLDAGLVEQQPATHRRSASPLPFGERGGERGDHRVRCR